MKKLLMSTILTALIIFLVSTHALAAIRLIHNVPQTVNQSGSVLRFQIKDFETENSDVTWDGGTRLIVRTPGIYQVNTSMTFYPASGYCGLYILVNGNQYKAGGASTPSSSIAKVNVSDLIKLNAGDYVEIHANAVGSAPTDPNGYVSMTRVAQ